MRVPLTVYLAVLGAIAVVSLVVSLDGVGIALLYITLGLAFPLFLLPALVPYMVAFLPTVAAIPRPRALMLALAGSLGLSVAWATIPHWLSTRQAEAVAARLTADDVELAAPLAARSLEIRRPPTFLYEAGGTFLPEEACPAFCRNLLLTGQLDWVRIVVLEPTRSRSEKPVPRVTLYAAASGAACSAPGEATEPGARCVVFAEDRGGPAGLTAEIAERSGIEGVDRDAGLLIRPRSQRVVTLTSGSGPAAATVMRNTELQLDVVTRGSFVVVALQGMNSGGFEFVRTRQVLNALPFETMLSRLGYRMNTAPKAPAAEPGRPSWSIPPSAEMSREVLSLLDLSTEARFNADQNRVIDSWVTKARAFKEWPQERVAFLRRIFRDERVSRMSFLDQVFEGNPEVTQALLPDLLERLSALRDDDYEDPSRPLGYALQRIEPRLLHPYAAKIESLVASSGAAAKVVIGAVGRIGIDPVRYLSPMVDAKGDIDVSRIKAACRAEPQWGPVLVPPLRAILTEARLSRGMRQVVDVVGALVRHGDSAFVIEIAARSADKRDSERVARIVKDFERWGEDRVC